MPELYAALTIAGPPVAIVKSQIDIRYSASGILGFSMHWKRSSGAPCAFNAATARYSGGPFRAQFDYATRKDVGNVAGQDRNAFKVGAGFSYAPGALISVIAGQVENKNLAANISFGGIVFAAAGTSPKTTIWIANWEHMFGQFQVIAQAAKFDNIKNLTVDPGGTDAVGFTLAGKYFLSKRTGVYASFNQVKNKENSWWDMSNGGSSSANTALAVANRGADPRIIAFGLMHNF